MKFPISNSPACTEPACRQGRASAGRQFPKKIKSYILGLNFFILIFCFLFIICYLVFGIWNFVLAATNISSANNEYWAWNDVIGWIDFYSSNNVNVSSTQLTGYTNSPVGYIALDCATSPNGNICSTSNFKVSNDGSGNLSGWAWSDAIGWISFNCTNTGTCGTSNYQVTISPSSGDFSGWAWNDNIGWISFNCTNTGTCGTSNYKVKTSWQSGPVSAILDSSVFDTGVSGGVVLNSAIWKGTLPVGTSVRIQIASSNCSNGATNPPSCNSGTWTYIGPDGTSNSYYSTNPTVSMPINFKYHNNYRYFRYRIFLYSDAGQTQTPLVEDVIINYSP